MDQRLFSTRLEGLSTTQPWSCLSNPTPALIAQHFNASKCYVNWMGSICGGTQKRVWVRCPLPAAGSECQSPLLGVDVGRHRGVCFPVTNSLSITELFAIISFQEDPHFAISLPCPGLDFFLIRAPKRAEFGTKLFCALSRPQSGGEMPAAH